MTALSDKSVAIIALQRVLRDLAPAQKSIKIAMRVMEAENFGYPDHVRRINEALKEAEREVHAEIRSLEEYWASGEPERLAALAAEVSP